VRLADSGYSDTRIERLEQAQVLQTPRYPGIDEVYVEGSIYCVLTDFERRCEIDILSKRDSDSVKLWLMRLLEREYFLAKERDQIEAGAIFSRRN
jgi:transposase